MDIEQLKLDVTLAVEGVWVSYRGDAQFLVASTDTMEYGREEAIAFEPILETRDKSRADGAKDEDLKWVDDALRDARLRVFCKHGVKGWRNLTSAGAEFPYSEANCFTLLSAPGAFPLLRFLRESAARFDAYRAKRLDEQKKA